MRRPVLLAAVALAAAVAVPAGAADPKPGAYCPLPAAGERPRCLDPAVAEYSEFFAALDEGQLDDADAARLEEDVAGGSDDSYRALSGLAYGYYRLAQQAAADPNADPAVRARLARWNEVLGRAYDASASDGEYREALQTAARDLHRRAPRVALECEDADGRPTECDATEVVLHRLRAGREEAGLRGALNRLVERVFGSGGR